MLKSLRNYKVKLWFDAENWMECTVVDADDDWVRVNHIFGGQIETFYLNQAHIQQIKILSTN